MVGYVGALGYVGLLLVFAFLCVFGTFLFDSSGGSFDDFWKAHHQTPGNNTGRKTCGSFPECNLQDEDQNLHRENNSLFLNVNELRLERRKLVAKSPNA